MQFQTTLILIRALLDSESYYIIDTIKDPEDKDIIKNHFHPQ